MYSFPDEASKREKLQKNKIFMGPFHKPYIPLRIYFEIERQRQTDRDNDRDRDTERERFNKRFFNYNFLVLCHFSLATTFSGATFSGPRHVLFWLIKGPLKTVCTSQAGLYVH